MKPEELVSEETSKIGAKRRGGEGLNPEELVSDKTRDVLRVFWYGTQDWMPEGPENDECDAGDVRRAFDAGFYLALEELRVARVEEVSGSECVTIFEGSRFEGAILVRAKEKP